MLSAPAALVEEAAQEAEPAAAARRRSTVREKVSFISAPVEPASAVSQIEPEPVAPPPPVPAEPAPAPAGDAAPRKAGWWSRRFGSGE